MPYKLNEDHGKWQVVGPDGKVVGEHATEAKAKAQLAALYANEKDLQKEDGVGETEAESPEEMVKQILATAGYSLHSFELRKLDEEQHIVEGFATTEQPDNQGGVWNGQRYSGDLITAEAVRKALPAYMDWANLREMHQASAVGTVLKAEVIEGDIEVDGQTYHNPLHIVAKVIDPEAWAKVKAGVYKGFSILGDLLDAVLDKIAGRVVRVAKAITLTEISLVDRPANPGAKILLWKGEGIAAPASENIEGGTDMAQETQISKAAADPQKATTDLQALRDMAELAGDVEKAGLYTQAITLLLQAEGEATETPEEEAAETPEEQAAEGETPTGEQPPEGAVPAELKASASGGSLRKAGRTFSTGNAKAMHGVIQALAKMMADSGDEVAAKVAACYSPASEAPKPEGESEVAKLAGGEELRKALEPIGQLEKALGSLTARLEALEAQPVPGGPAVRAISVDKTLPGVPAAATGPEIPVETLSIEELRKFSAVEPDPMQRLEYARRAWNAEQQLLKKSK